MDNHQKTSKSDSNSGQEIELLVGSLTHDMKNPIHQIGLAQGPFLRNAKSRLIPSRSARS